MAISTPTPFEQAAGSRGIAVRSQATNIEQSRAIAEVQAAVVIAQNRPRDVAGAMNEMRQVCAISALADRAFFRYARGGGNITGKSVHLARELARCWGNIDYGVKELDRDDARGWSEMLAFAWDLQTNARSEVTFIVPHMRDTKGGGKKLTDMRDIYENNANNAARRLRECIFAVLPVWFTEEAADLCQQTLEKGGSKPLPQRVADAIAAFSELRVSKAQMEAKIGLSSNSWTAQDVAALGVIHKSIKRGETTVDDEFPKAEQQAPTGDTAFEKAAAGAKDQPTKKGQQPKADPQPDPDTPAFTLTTADGEALTWEDAADAEAVAEEFAKELKAGGMPVWNNNAALRDALINAGVRLPDPPVGLV